MCLGYFVDSRHFISIFYALKHDFIMNKLKFHALMLASKPYAYYNKTEQLYTKFVFSFEPVLIMS